MAITQKFYNGDLTTGANDGTTEPNAWQTWAAIVFAAGELVNMKRTAVRDVVGSAQTISVSGTGLAPVLARGYTTTIGDGGLYQMDQRLSVTGELVSIEGMDVLVDASGFFAIDISGDLSQAYRCIGKNTHATALGGMQVSDGSIEHCLAIAEGASMSVGGVRVNSGGLVGSRVIVADGRVGVEVENGFRQNFIMLNQIRGGGLAAGGRGIKLDGLDFGGTRVLLNSIFNFENGIFLEEIPLATANIITLLMLNLMSSVTNGIRNNQAGVVETTVRIIGNAINAGTAEYSGFGDLPILNPISLTSDPWTDVANDDWSLNNLAGAGALVRGLGIPTDYDLDGVQDNFMSPGAFQLQSAAGGGLLVHSGMTGGMRG